MQDSTEENHGNLDQNRQGRRLLPVLWTIMQGILKLSTSSISNPFSNVVGICIGFTACRLPAMKSGITSTAGNRILFLLSSCYTEWAYEDLYLLCIVYLWPVELFRQGAPVAYPGILFLWGVQQISWGQRTDRTGIWGVGSPLVKGSGGSCNLHKKFHFI